MITMRDDSGASLLGAVDGVNTLYTTTYDMRLDRVVDVFVNGFCRMAELDNGYTLETPRTVQMKEALPPGDTLSVRYNATPVLVGAPDSQPEGLTVDDINFLGPPVIVPPEGPEAVEITLLCPYG